MWIQQPGRAYGPSRKPMRTGRNGGARSGFVQVNTPRPNGGFVQVKAPARGDGWTQVHPVLPGFERTRALPRSGALHNMVKGVNLQAAVNRFKQLVAPPGPRRTIGSSVTDPALLGDGSGPRKTPAPFFGPRPRLPYGGPPIVDPRMIRHPEGVGALRGGFGDFIHNEREQTALAARLAAGFAANPTLAPTTEIPGLAEIGFPQYAPPTDLQGPPPGTDFSGVDALIQQGLEQQRQAMLARLMRQHGAE